MIQDSKGYIWIGTNDGLNRYNGYDFKVYRHDEDVENTIANNYIVDLKEDNEGNIWAGTAKGLSKINTRTDEIKNYYSEINNGGLSHYNIGEVLITKDREIIVGTSDGINIYNKEKDEFENLKYNKEEITNSIIRTLVEDNEGNIWAGTCNGVNKINIKTGKVHNFYTNKDKSENIINKLYYDSEYIWVASNKDGLSKINIQTNEVITYINNNEDETSLPNNCVKSILRDKDNRLWIGSSGGLSIYDEKNNKFITNKSKAYDKNSLVANDVYTIIQDDMGLVWAGTYAGISIFDPNNKIEHYKHDPYDENSLNDNLVNGIHEDNEGLLWLGNHNNGVNILNRENDIVTNIDMYHDKYPLSDNAVNDVTGIDSYIFIATNNGLNKIDKNKDIIEVYTQKNGLPHSNIRTLFIDSKKNLWIGTAAGISILNIENNEIVDITNILKKNSVEDIYSGAIFEDSEGIYWLGGFIDGGLIKINPNDRSIKTYKYNEEDKKSISSNSVRTIAEDKLGNLWVGTSDGLNKFNKKKEESIRYKTKDGLANNTIYGILVDEGNNPWVSTNLGISKLDIERNTFKNFNITDGIQGNEFNGKSYHKNSKGEFLFGGINGLNIFNPEDMKIVSEERLPKVIFNEFKVNGYIHKDINGLEFKYNENFIKINVFLTDYKNTDQIKYYYKLDGSNNEWSIIDSNEINYSNLSPGEYTFRIIARNYDGELSEESSVNFVIKPHILASKVARVIYIIIIIAIIIISISRLKTLDQMVESRSKQLNSEMEKSNALLNKVIELEKNKNAYLINLSHELRTPLNVIYSTEQLVRELNKPKSGINKEKLDYYMVVIGRNSKRLLGLINNLIDSTKIDHGSYKIEMKENDIVYVVEEAALSLKQYAESKGINLIIDPEIEEKTILFDDIEIERCIVNLISNAIKFTPDGGKIEVVISDLGDKVKIEIIDNGMGIDKKYHESIFNRFNQVVDVNAEVKGGSGLGLTITKSIIEMHGGSIQVESEVNKGSKFTIIL